MNKRITIASGKGGVGKSMISSMISILFSKDNNVVAIDCDVDAPNLALWLGIDTSNKNLADKTKFISTTKKPQIDKSKCNNCGKCVQKCNFDALEKGKSYPKLISYRCEGCQLCKIVCPNNAIKMVSVKNCLLSIFQTDYNFSVIQGQIQPGEAESGEAVTEIRKYANSISRKDSIFIQDAAAGIGCPVIASIVNSNYVIIVAEPSKSSFSDMNRIIRVINQFEIPYGIVINKYGLNNNISNEIIKQSKNNFLGKVSYDQEIIKSIVNMTPIFETNLKAKKEIKDIFKKVNDLIFNDK